MHWQCLVPWSEPPLAVQKGWALSSPFHLFLTSKTILIFLQKPHLPFFILEAGCCTESCTHGKISILNQVRQTPEFRQLKILAKFIIGGSHVRVDRRIHQMG